MIAAMTGRLPRAFKSVVRTCGLPIRKLPVGYKVSAPPVSPSGD